MIEEIAFGSAAYDATLRLREAELRAPLGLALSAADRDGEESQIHLAARDGVAIVGTLVLQELAGGQIKLRQMAVAPAMRRRGLGRDLVRFAERLAGARGFREIVLDARVSAQEFYKGLGYRAAGIEFVRLGLPHVRMTKQLERA